MDTALIVSNKSKQVHNFKQVLSAASFTTFKTVSSCGEARRQLSGQDFDLVIVDAPLEDESGEDLARFAVSRGLTQSILVVKREFFEAVASATEDAGVLTVAKPFNEEQLWMACKLASANRQRLYCLQEENSKLKQRIEDIRIIDRAKCLLISYLNMTEHQAHRYIEKQSMDLRTSRRLVAERILHTYED